MPPVAGCWEMSRAPVAGSWAMCPQGICWSRSGTRPLISLCLLVCSTSHFNNVTKISQVCPEPPEMLDPARKLRCGFRFLQGQHYIKNARKQRATNQTLSLDCSRPDQNLLLMCSDDWPDNGRRLAWPSKIKAFMMNLCMHSYTNVWYLEYELGSPNLHFSTNSNWCQQGI